KCPPDIGPNAYAPVSTVRPNASDTPARPMPTLGNVAARMALPHPPNTSQKVPRNSAASCGYMTALPSRADGRRERVSASLTRLWFDREYLRLLHAARADGLAACQCSREGSCFRGHRHGLRPHGNLARGCVRPVGPLVLALVRPQAAARQVDPREQSLCP